MFSTAHLDYIATTGTLIHLRMGEKMRQKEGAIGFHSQCISLQDIAREALGMGGRVLLYGSKPAIG